MGDPCVVAVTGVARASDHWSGALACHSRTAVRALIAPDEIVFVGTDTCHVETPVRLNSKGQVTIPAELRRRHCLREGDEVDVIEDGETLRIVTMKITRAGFVVMMTLSVILSMLQDRDVYRRGALRASLRRLRTSPLVSKATWRHLREYDRRGFHPDDRNTDDLTERWRDELFGTDGRLTDLVVGSPAA